MSRYYNRRGQPITMDEWAALLEGNDPRRVAETTLEDGTWVSTVWLGLDHGHNGPPLIFETMIFAPPPQGEDRFVTFPAMPEYSIEEHTYERHLGDELYCERYPTEEAALAGHDRAVEIARRKDYE